MPTVCLANTIKLFGIKMGPGNRIEVTFFKGIMFGIQYNRWPYQHSVNIGFFCLNIFIGLGLPYTDSNYKA